MFTQADAQRACSEEKRTGLLELKSFLKIQVMNGAEHVALPSWVDDPMSDCCGWERLSCNSTTGRLQRLSLFNWNITLVQSFKHLKTLILAYNCMRWKENQGMVITYMITSNIFKFLAHNILFIGSNGWSRLQQLETLDLSYNILTSSHLHSLRKLKSLKNLNLSGNSFNGSFPARGQPVTQQLIQDPTQRGIRPGPELVSASHHIPCHTSLPPATHTMPCSSHHDVLAPCRSPYVTMLCSNRPASPPKPSITELSKKINRDRELDYLAASVLRQGQGCRRGRIAGVLRGRFRSWHHRMWWSTMGLVRSAEERRYGNIVSLREFRWVDFPCFVNRRLEWNDHP
ncbi:hypothetical protein F3Y22_tig00111191pilonHSYRG00148 [Hibiscus syriacus]|uniref:Leucine-rich repeat-containing N-terminal plant-type domain-containing protein n=1 Tax=Hibiscus syriacus TaxID=106335 RepID=A0A6A2YWD1_HIBSY|nr:hypothetical protein F3Y22_tig00111191pilonHSYRG00148 [Hibiscus syriacus]